MRDEPVSVLVKGAERSTTRGRLASRCLRISATASAVFSSKPAALQQRLLLAQRLPGGPSDPPAAIRSFSAPIFMSSASCPAATSKSRRAPRPTLRPCGGAAVAPWPRHILAALLLVPAGRRICGGDEPPPCVMKSAPRPPPACAVAAAAAAPLFCRLRLFLLLLLVLKVWDDAVGRRALPFRPAAQRAPPIRP